MDEHDQIAIGKFVIRATYTFAKGLLGGPNPWPGRTACAGRGGRAGVHHADRDRLPGGSGRAPAGDRLKRSAWSPTRPRCPATGPVSGGGSCSWGRRPRSCEGTLGSHPPPSHTCHGSRSSVTWPSGWRIAVPQGRDEMFDHAIRRTVGIGGMGVVRLPRAQRRSIGSLCRVRNPHTIRLSYD
jgi:hypothetical protein